VRQVELHVTAGGLARSAGAGETPCPLERCLNAELTFHVPATGWRPGPNHVDLVELIGMAEDGARVLAQGKPNATGPALSFASAVPPKDIVFRARIQPP